MKSRHTTFWALTVVVTLACIQKAESQQIKMANGKAYQKEVYDRFFKDLMDSLNMPGLAVAILNDGQVVYDESYGIYELGTDCNIESNTYFEAASLSKPVFAFSLCFRQKKVF